MINLLEIIKKSTICGPYYTKIGCKVRFKQLPLYRIKK